MVGGSSGNNGYHGTVLLKDDSLGGTARIQVLGNSQLDISGHHAPGVTTGSISGSGLVFLGANSLTVAGNLSSAFSGVIQDGGASGGVGGSFVKTGKGTLILSGANTYTGGTTVNQGTLSIGNTTGSATGTGAVQVNRGTLAGTGTISGSVTIAGGSATASLAPGAPGRTGSLSVQSPLTFGSRTAYRADLNSTAVTADEVEAFGVVIASGAQISLDDLLSGALLPGTAFTVISNTAATPIAGTFSNLADNSMLTIGSHTYLVSYEGGDRNDLTLTVQ